MNGITLQKWGKAGNYRALFTVNGKRYCRATKTPDRRAAFQRAKALKAAIDNDAWEVVASVTTTKGQATVGDWSNQYLIHTATNAATAKKNRNRLRLLYREALGVDDGKVDGVKIGTLSRDKVEAWIAKRQGVSSPCFREEREINTTINNILRLAKSMFTGEVSRRICEELKVTAPRLSWVKIPALKEPSHKYQPIPDEVIQQIKDASELERMARPWMWITTQLMLMMGLRASEVYAARRHWVEDMNGTLVLHIKNRPGEFIPKTKNSARTMIVPDELRDSILSSADFLVPGKTPTQRHNRIYREHSAWLREFIPGRTKSNHELRKHAGSIVASLHGIEAGARFLGDTVATTEAHYHGLLSLVPAIKSGDVVGFKPRVIEGRKGA